MPRIKLTKGAIDALPTRAADVVYWDNSCPGFGIKVTPKGRKVFIVLYRTGGAGSKLRKYTIGPYGKVTLHQARIAVQKVFSAKLEGRDPAREKREARIREVTDRVADVLEAYITQHISTNRSAAEVSRLLRREVGGAWGHKSIHDISKRDVVELVSAMDQRGAPAAANKTLKSIKTFLGWCVGRAILDKSPAEGVPLPAREVARDRILSDVELAKVIRAARTMAGPYGGIVEFLALTGQRREEVAQSTWDEFDLKAALGRYPRHGRRMARRTLCISHAQLSSCSRECRSTATSFSLLRARNRFVASRQQSVSSTRSRGSPSGGFTICDAPACLAWLALASPHTLRTRCSITKRGRFPG